MSEIASEKLRKEFERVLTLARAEQMSMVDFVKEFEKLLDQCNHLEAMFKRHTQEIEDHKLACSNLERELKDLAKQLVPQEELLAYYNELKEKEEKFLKYKFEFDAQRSYIIRENDTLREILSSVLARKEINERIFDDWYQPPAHTDNNGNWITPPGIPTKVHDRLEKSQKPNLKGGLFTEKKTEKPDGTS